MPHNRGATTLKRSRRAGPPMDEFDRLPQHLRLWMAEALLPWRAASVKSAYQRAYAKTGTPEGALRELDRLQLKLVAKDARQIWGPEHPLAAETAPAARNRVPL